jgi:GrpB-like predicted nucleotidyltransferase (UPF0157 family)
MTTSPETPAWATEHIHLEPYISEWPERAQTFKHEIAPLIGPYLSKPIEHVGSTAVPGLIAKPVIDLMAMVSDLDLVASQQAQLLHAAGWEYVPPEFDNRPWRRLFVKVSADGEHRLAHLHLMAEGAARWDEQLRFRDALRANTGLRDEYAAIKQQLADKHATDREAYTNEKATFIRRVLDQPPG